MARAKDSLRRQLVITCYDIDTSSHLPAMSGNLIFYRFNIVTESNSNVCTPDIWVTYL